MKHMKANQLSIRFPAAIGCMLATAIATAAMAADVPTRKESVLTNVTATVDAIDHKTREVTLKDPSGNQFTFTAGPEIKRLDEIHVGDTVNAKYYMSFVAELREPTEEEKQKPLTILDATARATEGDPAGANVQRIRVVTTVEMINRTAGTVTVKGPLKRFVTAKVEKPEVLEKLKIGQTIVITYTEAVGISLEKTVGKAKE